MQAIEQAPPSASTANTVTATVAEAKAAAAIEAKDAGEAEATMSGNDKIISEVVKDATAEEDVATAPVKEREIDSVLQAKKILTFGTWAVRSFSKK
jgi:CRISPR/Cas system CMR-associated protein Cmr5 small subunit